MTIGKSTNVPAQLCRYLTQSLNGIILIGLAALINASVLHIVTAENYTLKDFVEASDVIVVARIKSTHAKYMTVRTKQYDGSISIDEKAIFTVYQLEISKKYSASSAINVKEFVMPGGNLEGHSRRWSHIPELQPDMEVLIGLNYDPLNNFYIPNGIPPVGPKGSTFIVMQTPEKKFLIPYLQYDATRSSITESGNIQIRSFLNPRSEAIELASSDAIDFDAFWSAVQEAGNEK